MLSIISTKAIRPLLSSSSFLFHHGGFAFPRFHFLGMDTFLDLLTESTKKAASSSSFPTILLSSNKSFYDEL